MESIIALQGFAGVVYLVTVSVIGIRLLLLASRSHQLPEMLLGGALLLGGVFGGPLEAASVSLRAETGPELSGKLLFGGKVFGLAAIACHLFFIHRVFRPDREWSTALVGVLLACPLAAIFGYSAAGAFGTSEIPLTWFWVELLARVSASAWLTVEGALYFIQMRRRLRLGLSEPLVTNRFLLFSMAGGLSIVIFLTSVPPMFLDPVLDARVLTLDLLVFSIAGIAVSSLYFLTFLPPRRYREWLGTTPEVTS
jgi:hypothetical protein